MGFLVEKSAIERLEIECFYLQYCKSTFPLLWWDKLLELPLSFKGLEVGVFIQIIEFLPSHLEDEQVKIYFRTPTLREDREREKDHLMFECV